MSDGHVFVIRGALAHLDYDAVVVSTDKYFVVEGHWSEVLGTGLKRDAKRHSAADALKPAGWETRRYGRALERDPGQAARRPTWFLDVANYGDPDEQGIAKMMRRLDGLLRDVAEAGLPLGSGRVAPLVAMPTVGVRGGGFGPQRGAVVEKQLDVCERLAVELGLDIVIVATSTSDYSAFQARRRARSEGDPRQAWPLRAEARTLGNEAQRGRLALFVGAGVSMSAGLPSWDDLIDGLLEEAQEAGADPRDLDIKGWSALDKAELLQSVLGGRFGEAVISRVTADRYGISHAMLAALGCREVATTNFDTLYEMAAADVVGQDVVSVLPFGRIPVKAPWVLKMHGDVSDAASIVLSRSDFVGYDAKERPLGSILQSLMLTRHLLVVGTSMTDDNFLRLAHEVVAFSAAKGRFAPDGAAPASLDADGSEIGTVVTLGAEPARARLWQGRFRYLPASSSTDVNNQARDLAIFLDAVAMYAAGESHLLDERYGNLLDEDEKALAAEARQLLKQVDRLPSEQRDTRWSGLVAGLRELGAAGEDDGATSSGSPRPR